MSSIDLRSILVASDLSGGSDEILRAAGALAALTRADLHVLHAFDLGETPHVTGPDAAATFPGRIAEAEQVLAALVRRSLPPGRAATSQRVVIRSAYKAILERAVEVRADLIVLGPHQRHAVGDRLLGSTADRVIRTAEVPCLIVRASFSLPLRTVAVPIDLSEHARGALEVALTWGLGLGYGSVAGVPDVRVDVLHVIPSIFETKDFAFDRVVIEPELDREIESALAHIEGASELEVREQIVWGDRPADEIVRFARENRSDLLVLGTHGYGAIRRALIGSVASGVARLAPCSVLLVPPRFWREEHAAPDAREHEVTSLVTL